MSERKKRWKAGSDFLSSAAAIWMVPLAALLMGGWMLFQHWYEQGPLVTLTVARAEGIVAGKTPIRARDVDIGRIESVELSEDFSHAILQARINKPAADMLRGDSLFWLVKPRVGREGVSGLSTLLSGSYIELSPGKSGKAKRRYQVQDTPPLASNDQKGLHLTLTSSDTRALGIGSPVQFQGFAIGQVEQMNFIPEKARMEYKIFIRAPYDSLVNSNSRFWMTPGFEVSVSSEGMKVKMDSLETLLDGGITMGLPDGWSAGEPVKDHSDFTLFKDQASVLEGNLSQFINYVFLFQDSLAGLHPGAAVQYRGIRVGTVVSVPYIVDDKIYNTFNKHTIPVLARIEVQRLSHRYADSDHDQWRKLFEQQFRQGLRASVKTSSLLTGGKIIDLNFYNETAPYKAMVIKKMPVFPTVTAGFDQIERKVNKILDKFADMDVEHTLVQVNQTLATLDKTLQSVRSVSNNLDKLTGQQATRELPDSLNQSLRQLQQTLQSYDGESRTNRELQKSISALNQMLRELQPLVRSLNEQPNALIFDRNSNPDPQPKRGER